MENSDQIDLQDRISKLPDDLLCQILSFLPTKFAAATSVLSTRWIHLLDSLPNIDLDDSLLSFPPRESFPISEDKFYQFVYRILRSSNSNISRFRIKCTRMYPEYIINEWLLFALCRNLRELDFYGMYDKSGSLPAQIFMCKTLEILKLGSSGFLQVPEHVSLPKLKVIGLKLIYGLTNSIMRVFSGCPVLEDLSIINCRLVNVDVFEISSRSLKKLKLSFCFGLNRIVLDTPMLQKLEYNRCEGRACSVKYRESIVSLAMSWESTDDFDHFRDATDFVNGMCSIKSLYLTDAAINALYRSRRALATFEHLTYMELGTSHRCGWLLLPELLACSPNLEVLVFADGFIDHSGDQRPPREEFEYRLPETVPACLSQRLREIKIGKFEAKECEFKLVEYFLEKAQVLKKVVIGYEVHSDQSPYGLKMKRWTVFKEPKPWVSPTSERLSRSTRCSESCQIKLQWNDGGNLCNRILD